MKYFTLTFAINEAKLKAIIDRKATATAKEQARKLFPALPLVYTATNKSGDKSAVDNWTREIKGTKKIDKTEKGYIFYTATFEMPNYANLKIDPRAPLFIRQDEKKYEQDFEKFVRDYMSKQNSLVGIMFILGKFSGKVSTVTAVKEATKEKKKNYVDNPINQIKEQVEEQKEWFKKYKKEIIIGGTVIAFIGVAVILK